MTAILTQNVNQAPVMPVKRPIAALDAGNRTTQWIITPEYSQDHPKLHQNA